MNRSITTWIATAGVLAVAPLATAAFEGAALIITASNAQGTGQIVIPIEHGFVGNGGETFSYTLPSAMAITSQSGAHIATLVNFNEMLIADPVVSIGFSVLAGAADTDFTISTALLSFPAINNAIGSASGSVTVTDVDGNGASIAGIGGAPIFEWDYNGLVPTGTNFVTFVNGTAAGAFQSATDSANFGPVVIGGNVSDISGAVNFRLSANDRASGTGVFVVEIPTPGAIGLASLAGLTALRRRRR